MLLPYHLFYHLSYRVFKIYFLQHPYWAHSVYGKSPLYNVTTKADTAELLAQQTLKGHHTGAISP